MQYEINYVKNEILNGIKMKREYKFDFEELQKELNLDEFTLTSILKNIAYDNDLIYTVFPSSKKHYMVRRIL